MNYVHQKFLSEFILNATLDKDNIIIQTNKNFYQTAGYSLEELIGQPYTILDAGFHSKGFLNEMMQILTSGNSWRAEVCNRAKDGTLYWLDTHIIPEIDANGKALRYHIFGVLITNRKFIEQQYLQLFEENPNPMWIYDLETLRFLVVNHAMVEQYGYTTEEFMNMSILELRTSEDQLQAKLYIDEIKAKKYVHSSIQKHQRKNKEVFYTRKSSYLGVWKNKPARVVLAIDIDEQMHAIEHNRLLANSLMRSEEVFRQLFENSIEGIILTENKGQIYAVNPSACSILGRSESELMRLKFHEIIDWKGIDSEDTLKIINNEDRFQGQLFFIDAKGRSFSVEVTSDYFDNSKGERQNSILFKDISERVKATTQIEQQTKQLFEAEAELRQQNLYLSSLNGIIQQKQEMIKGVLDSSMSGIVALSCIRNIEGKITDFKFILVNNMAQSIMKRPLEDLIGRRLNVEYPKHIDFGLFENYKKVVETGDAFHTEIDFGNSTAFTAMWIRVTAVKLGDGLVITFQDITSKKISAQQMIEETQKKERLLARVQRQNAKLREIAWIQSHKVRAPIANILGLVSVIDLNEPNSDDNAGLLQKIIMVTKQLDTIIHEVVNKTYEVEDEDDK